MKRNYAYYYKGILKHITIISDEKLRIFKVIKDNSSSSDFVISFDDTNFDYFLNQLINVLTYNGFLTSIYLNLNYTCNQDCIHCCNPKDMNSYSINFEQAKKIIDEASDLGAFYIILTGGECTINNDFIKIAKYITEKQLRLFVLTNSQKLYDDEKLFNDLINLYPAQVQITLFSMNPLIHDKITRVKGSQHKTVEVIKKLRAHKIITQIACNVIDCNFNEYKQVKEFADSIGAKFLKDVRFINNKNNNNIDVRLKGKKLLDYYLETIDVNNPRENFCNKERFTCSGGIDRLSIAPDLDIHPCNYFNYPLGNFNTISLKEVREKIVPEFQKKLTCKNLKDCFKHEYCKFCEYCPIYTCYDKGFLKKSKTLCEDAKAYYSAYLKHKQKSCRPG